MAVDEDRSSDTEGEREVADDVFTACAMNKIVVVVFAPSVFSRA